MTTTDHVLLIVLTVLLSIFIIAGIFVLVGIVKLVSVVRLLVIRAEGVVDNVESATEIFKDTQGRLALFKLVRNIVKLAKKGSK